MAIITDLEILRTKSENVSSIKEAEEIIVLLEQELERSARIGRRGIGLSGIQINIPKKVAIVRVSDKYRVNLVNSEIAHRYDEFVFKDEGCLSLPDVIKDTKRFNEIHIVNNLVFPEAFICTGLMAVCCAHEMEHWEGINLADKPNLTPTIKPKPHENCYCGSNRKYRKCCMLKEQNAQ